MLRLSAVATAHNGLIGQASFTRGRDPTVPSSQQIADPRGLRAREVSQVIYPEHLRGQWFSAPARNRPWRTHRLCKPRLGRATFMVKLEAQDVEDYMWCAAPMPGDTATMRDWPESL